MNSPSDSIVGPTTRAEVRVVSFSLPTKPFDHATNGTIANVFGQAPPLYRREGRKLRFLRFCPGPLKDTPLILHLEGVDLSKLDLTKGNYERISFVKAKFSDATLADTQFDAADLTDGDLDGADLRQAALSGRAKLINASLRRARLFHAVLRGADLSGAVLTGANLWHCDLREADFTDAKLDSSFLLEADLRGAHFQGADPSGAVILPAQFDSASEEPTNLPGAPPDAPRVTGVLHANPRVPVGKDSPAQPGEFLEIYCKGLGDLRWAKEGERTSYPHTAEVVHVIIGGEEAAVPDYAGISPTDPADYQVNVYFPKVQPGKHSLKLVVGGRSSEGFEIESGSPH